MLHKKWFIMGSACLKIALFFPSRMLAMEVNATNLLQRNLALPTEEAISLVHAYLAKYYLYAIGGPNDFSKAFDYASRANQQRINQEAHILGTVLLGEIYFHGAGRDKDLQRAFSLYTEVASQTTELWAKALADLRIGRFYFEGLAFAKDFNKAFDFYQRAANQDFNMAAQVAAYLELGDIFTIGNGVAQDLPKAFDCYMRACKQEHSIVVWRAACLKLGKCYVEGKGVDRDLEKGAEYYKAIVDFKENSVANELATQPQASAKIVNETNESKNKPEQEQLQPASTLDVLLNISKKKGKGPIRRAPQGKNLPTLKKDPFFDRDSGEVAQVPTTPAKKITGGVSLFGAGVANELQNALKKR